MPSDDHDAQEAAARSRILRSIHADPVVPIWLNDALALLVQEYPFTDRSQSLPQSGDFIYPH